MSEYSASRRKIDLCNVFSRHIIMGKPEGVRTNKTVTPSVRKAQELKKKAVRIAQGVARRDAFLRLLNQPLEDDEMDPFEAYAASLPPRKSIRRGGTRKTIKRRKSRAKRRTRRR